MGGLQQKLILSKFWWPEVQNEGLSKAEVLRKSLEENPALFFESLVTPGVLWLVATWLHSPLCALHKESWQ